MQRRCVVTPVECGTLQPIHCGTVHTVCPLHRQFIDGRASEAHFPMLGYRSRVFGSGSVNLESRDTNPRQCVRGSPYALPLLQPATEHTTEQATEQTTEQTAGKATEQTVGKTTEQTAGKTTGKSHRQEPQERPQFFPAPSKQCGDP